MEHFSQQVFVDLVRGIDGPAYTELRSHLANQCRQCVEAVEIWGRLHAIAGREGEYNPPENSVRMTKLGFTAIVNDDKAISAKVVFDSLLQPALAGVRSAGTVAARQMVYEAEGLLVDLRFDQPSPSKSISLIGQVLDQKSPRSSQANATVMLWTEKGLVLAETRTNAMGEFHIEFELQNCMRLSIQSFNGKLIRIPLAGLNPVQVRGGITEGTNTGYQ